MKKGWSVALILLITTGSTLYLTRSERVDVDLQPGYCKVLNYKGKTITTYTTGEADSVIIGWMSTQSKPHRSFSSFTSERGDSFRLVTNAGMFHKNRQPVGLYIEDDSIMNELDTASGGGNFYMKPNGVFGMMKGTPWIGTTTDYLAEKPDLQLATQSGPMLLIDGAVHPRFGVNSPNRNLRSGVGVDDQNRTVFAIAQDITFYEFATVFRDSLRCSNALYLDGAISKMYLNTDSCSNSLSKGNFGPILGVRMKNASKE